MEIQLADDGTPPNINCAPRPKDLRFVFDAFVCVVCSSCRVLYSETGITKRICFRLQSRRTVRKCQRRRRCVRVCVFIYIYIWYRCKYITCICILCIQYYIGTLNYACAGECVLQNGIGASVACKHVYVSACGKHDRHLVPRPPCKKQFCSNLIDSISRVMQILWPSARSMCIIYLYMRWKKTHTPKIFVWIQVWPNLADDIIANYNIVMYS